MEKESKTTDFIPLLEDIETPVSVSADSIYPVKHKKKECKKAKALKKFLVAVLKVLFVAFLLSSAVATVAGYRWYRWMSQEVQRFTVTESNSFPVQEVPQSELEALKESAKNFWDSIQSDKVPVDDFVLTAREVNGFVAASDFLRSNALAEMKDNQLKFSVSLPTDFLPGGKGRFFNAYETIQWYPETNRLTIKMDSHDFEDPIGQYVDAEFELSTMEDGKTLNLQVIKGKFFYHIPKEFIDEHYNLLEEVYNCDCHDDDCKQARKFLEGLAGVSLEDGQVVVHADPEPKEATYYKEHEGHDWGHHHGHHGHGHHGKHGGHHHHGGRRALRENRAKTHGHRHLKALHMVRRLLA